MSDNVNPYLGYSAEGIVAAAKSQLDGNYNAPSNELTALNLIEALAERVQLLEKIASEPERYAAIAQRMLKT